MLIMYLVCVCEWWWWLESEWSQAVKGGVVEFICNTFPPRAGSSNPNSPHSTSQLYKNIHNNPTRIQGDVEAIAPLQVTFCPSFKSKRQSRFLPWDSEDPDECSFCLVNDTFSFNFSNTAPLLNIILWVQRPGEIIQNHHLEDNFASDPIIWEKRTISVPEKYFISRILAQFSYYTLTYLMTISHNPSGLEPRKFK